MTVAPEPQRRQWSRGTPPDKGPGNLPLYLCMVLFVAGFGAVGSKLFILQVRDAETYKLLARRQSEMRLALHAERGTVSDRTGKIIVSSARCWSFGADLSSVDNRDSLAATFATVFGKPRKEYLDKMQATDGRFVWLERGVDDQLAQRLESESDGGLVRLREPQRRYERELGAQLIGGTNVDNEGISGLELTYDSVLSGLPGFVMLERDGIGRRRPDVDLPHLSPVQGEDLVLTIDATFQSVVEEELANGVRAAQADAGTAVMLDPHTGEILAMASYTAGTSAHRDVTDHAAQRCRAVTDVFEPGSTFKIVATAAALEDNLVHEDEHFYAEQGTYHLYDATITDAHAMGDLSFADAVAQSSNICFAKLALRFRRENFYKYVRDFGFGIPTGIDLPGEVRGNIVKPDQSTASSQMFNAFGYGVDVTPLQLAAAYGAIANGGVLMRPFIVKEHRNTRGEIISSFKPQVVRRVVSEQTAKRVTALLCGVVEHGTGTEAKLASYRVAGKTGTSQQLVGGAYSKSKYAASFVGYFPAENPDVVLLVTLDAPRNGYYGGAVAAPVFRQIAQRVASSPSHLHMVVNGTPTPAPSTHSLVVPDLRYLSVSAAERTARASGFTIQQSGSGELIVQQTPPAGSPVGSDGVVRVTLSPMANAAGVPDARGLTMRQAVNMFSQQRIPVRVVGSGLVAMQTCPSTSRDTAWTLVGTVQ